MQDSENTENQEGPHEAPGSPPAVADTTGTAESGGADSAPEPAQDLPSAAPSRARPGRAVRLVACTAAGVMALGVGFGLTKIIHPPRVVPPPSVIPSPAKSGGVFTEDDDETGQDSESNILQTTAPGLVHIMSGGQAVGIGLVLTPSGKVLTTYQPSGGAGNLSAKYLVSGAAFQATVLGTDPAAGLALLQMEGGHGRAFSTLQVGNSDALADNAYAAQQLSYHITGEVMDTAVGTTGTQDAVIIDTGLLIALNRTFTANGKTLTGLLQSRLQSSSESEIGGPLVNLNGQVIGITVAGDGTGLKINGYAMPINQALAIARQIDTRARHTS
jgi:S1-C subfamily serine protease